MQFKLMDVGTAEKKVKAENANWCILTLFETIFCLILNCREKNKKTRALYGAF